MSTQTLSPVADIAQEAFDTRIVVTLGMTGHAYVEATQDGAVAISLDGNGEMCVSPATARAFAAALQAVATHQMEQHPPREPHEEQVAVTNLSNAVKRSAFRLETIAVAADIPAKSLTRKLSGFAAFTVREVISLCRVLDLDLASITNEDGPRELRRSKEPGQPQHEELHGAGL